MKFFGWVQNKLNGKPGRSKPQTDSATNYMKQEPRQEFSDWPHGLLAIGTFGNNNDMIENPPSQNTARQDPFDIREEHEPSSSEDLHEFTPEEVGKLEKELTKLLSRKPASDVKKELANLPLDRFLNCPSSLEVDRRISNAVCSDSGDKSDQEDIDRTISVILGRCKDICAEKNKKSIGKKSLSFLLKKMFACGSGFSPAPSLRDVLQESKMERLLRVMLHKKIYNQNPSGASAVKKYLEDRQSPKRRNKLNNEDETQERKSEDGYKWVKTDSEYIVLEI
ncbi:hypothetical protein E1A91_D05G150700v1 [Gossypium mustelinum]|uniref:NGR2 n=6 Tax=Gossypium TaxID=3633 RepID=A0A0D2TK15_GOSRA|nr:protein NEGATIVE GRAVITROPIC RESPONSE OF ROOTS [Gossypium raimondii]KJB57034.1 hypothetical protein B456_009G145800 [Gossypium raimondii]KJB57035.1 hypothetical protein B456_009G145800 [Gossypium raimondii]TYI81388.1 hypothetical protein E1A91_D05G150700v1 [Gossypium mustelinum]